MFDICMQILRVEQKAESVTSYFTRLKKTTAELALLLPFSFGCQVLFNYEILSLAEAFSHVLHIESFQPGLFVSQPNSALISKHNNNSQEKGTIKLTNNISSQSVLHDQESEKMIENAKMFDGLYYFDKGSSSK
ncbi:uncharacterized protein E5676_scaffold600G001500 [Cucumis melo var. makuwa]|uniref:Uncharacterized protein n=1 Tax=Cucumis melo var. makuwa TaxID=1194695 RepID=A0A5D3DXG7_CUCMM|nr:uncharacterized protein E6C27_scaffold61G001480 [Cucumis melo var. makuwa]TYK28321.1 uncharacterized protein E5676_scaffold600G001500 [Cucumis melo var. makuwa]